VQAVKQSAEYLWCHFLHHYGNYPPVDGGDLICSAVEQLGIDDPNTAVYNLRCGKSLVSTVASHDGNENDGDEFMLIVRNPSGKYQWNCRCYHGSADDKRLAGDDLLGQADQLIFRSTDLRSLSMSYTGNGTVGANPPQSPAQSVRHGGEHSANDQLQIAADNMETKPHQDPLMALTKEYGKHFTILII
jgi:hypothetical protein